MRVYWRYRIRSSVYYSDWSITMLMQPQSLSGPRIITFGPTLRRNTPAKTFGGSALW